MGGETKTLDCDITWLIDAPSTVSALQTCVSRKSTPSLLSGKTNFELKHQPEVRGATLNFVPIIGLKKKGVRRSCNTLTFTNSCPKFWVDVERGDLPFLSPHHTMVAKGQKLCRFLTKKFKQSSGHISKSRIIVQLHFSVNSNFASSVRYFHLKTSKSVQFSFRTPKSAQNVSFCHKKCTILSSGAKKCQSVRLFDL